MSHARFRWFFLARWSVAEVFAAILRAQPHAEKGTRGQRVNPKHGGGSQRDCRFARAPSRQLPQPVPVVASAAHVARSPASASWRYSTSRGCGVSEWKAGFSSCRLIRPRKRPRPHDLARAPLRQPAVDPGRDGADQKNVEHRKDNKASAIQPNRSGRTTLMPTRRPSTAESAQDGGNIHHAEDQMEQVKRAKANRKSQQSVDDRTAPETTPSRSARPATQSSSDPEKHRHECPFSGRWRWRRRRRQSPSPDRTP